MRNLTETNLTDAVLAKLEGAADPRFAQVMTSLIKHLHAFVREVELTEAEWLKGIQFLTATGQKCDDKRQEFILLSDTLGVSMLVDAINHRKPSGATESTVLGPFYVSGGKELPFGSNIAEGVPGEPTYFSGRVLSTGGKPIPGAMLDLWSTDGEGAYDVQLGDGNTLRARGKIKTDAQGRYAFWTIKPVGYPIPTDGLVGRLLKAQDRHPYRPAHLHALIFKQGFKVLISQVYDPADPHIDSDVQFGVTKALIGDFVRHDEPHPTATDVGAPWYSLDYVYKMEAGEAVLPRPPIK